MNASSLRLLALENQLRKAIEEDELLLHFQPKVDGRTGRIVGAEALVRWQNAEFGIVPPGEFIGVAEERGLIGHIGSWVMRAACKENLRWQEAGCRPIPVAVNVSSRQFWHSDFRGLVEEILRDTRLAGPLLHLEITESCLMRDVEATVAMLGALRQLGVDISIDDFGTGFSSLSMLRRLPLDSLKIDRAFVSEATEDRGASMVASAIIGLANSLGLRVIAEGVETNDQREFLLERNCATMQGFLFSRPVPAAEFERLLAEDGSLLPETKPED
jgi:EAL domain-containing protein (putative c-di-GMP-specific phosphodiesterase class I)